MCTCRKEVFALQVCCPEPESFQNFFHLNLLSSLSPLPRFLSARAPKNQKMAFLLPLFLPALDSSPVPSFKRPSQKEMPSLLVLLDFNNLYYPFSLIHWSNYLSLSPYSIGLTLPWFPLLLSPFLCSTKLNLPSKKKIKKIKPPPN